MFTGIVEEAGRVVRVTLTEAGCRFSVDAACVADGVKVGDSIANNGCCLTVVEIDGTRLSFDLLEETRRCTNLQDLREGSLVNLERSLAVGDRMGGHFVTGHVDGTGKITAWEPRGGDYYLEIEVPKGLERYLVPKGSVAVDGISLTVGEVKGGRFNVWIIPHTLEVTALQERTVGDLVNLEFDMLAKYVEKLLKARA